MPQARQSEGGVDPAGTRRSGTTGPSAALRLDVLPDHRLRAGGHNSSGPPVLRPHDFITIQPLKTSSRPQDSGTGARYARPSRARCARPTYERGVRIDTHAWRSRRRYHHAPAPATNETPFVSLMTLANVFAVARCLHAIADAGVADALEDAPAPATTLAAATGTHPEALDRVLRLLSAYGIFGHSSDGYRHTPMSRLLRSNDPQSLRSFVRMSGSPAAWTDLCRARYAVRTGAPAVKKALSQTLWEYLSLHQDEARIFDKAMAAQAKAHVDAVVSVYDLFHFRRHRRHRRRTGTFAACRPHLGAAHARCAVRVPASRHRRRVRHRV